MRRLLVVVVLSVVAGCAHRVPLKSPSGAAVQVPGTLAVALEVVEPGDKDYIAADPAGALGMPGNGGVYTAVVVRLTKDLPVYRLWAGPAVVNAQGQTSRMGQYWTFDAPTGTRAGFRRRYEVCATWNTLEWVAQCTLRRGAVVVIGPGQSVSAQTCGDPKESYPANDRDLQTYIHEAWNRTSPPDAELNCPDPSLDYRNDPGNIAKPIEATTR